MPQSNIRNFCIIAHIDHGKSTLADRLLELTGTVDKRRLVAQTLDTHPVSRERGITIRLAPVTMSYQLPVFSSRLSASSEPVIGRSAQETEKLKTEKPEAENRQPETDNRSFILNLIDTPGHVDFSYEVERSLAAAEGAILLVDATQGIQAQTLAHFSRAKKLGLTIIPAINKIDLPNARIEETEKELIGLLSLGGIGSTAGGDRGDSLNANESDPDKRRGAADERLRSGGDRTRHVHKISAKTGQGVKELLEAVIREVPPPQGNPAAPLRALVFSSQFLPARGVVAFVRLVDGRLANKEKIALLASGVAAEALEIGHFTPEMKPADFLETGEVGYIITNIKDPSLVRVGDTITTARSQEQIARSNSGSTAINYAPHTTCHALQATSYELRPLPGYREPKPVVFVSFFPADPGDFLLLEDALQKLRLNDAALSFSPASSKILGRGFRAGFLGRLHAEITQERLETDFNLSVIATPPTVEYLTAGDDGENSLAKMGGTAKGPPGVPEKRSERSEDTAEEHPRDGRGDRTHKITEQILEPWAKATIFSPKTYLGAVITLCEERRGEMLNLEYRAENAVLTYELPLAEIISDFFDRLKALTAGFASLDYEPCGARPFAAVSLEILINHEPIDAFSQIMERSRAGIYGRAIVEKLKNLLPRQQFPFPIQAAINGEIIARADVPAFRKDVTAKLYGGDFTRRLKLLEKQKRGKAKMRQIGRVSLPPNLFFQIFST